MNISWMSDLVLKLKIPSDAQWYLYICLIASVIGISGALIIVIRASKDWILRWNVKKKKEYLKGIMTEEYIAWEKETLKGIYPEDACKGKLVHSDSGDVFYPVITKEGSPNVVFDPEKGLTGFECELILSDRDFGDPDEEIAIKRLPHYKEFKKIVQEQVKRPELYGYTNIGFFFENGETKEGVKGFRALPRTYKETVYTCHVLQYELWKAFKKKKRLSRVKCRDYIPAGTLKDLPLRNKIHTGSIYKTNKERIKSKRKSGEYLLQDVIYNGRNRSSLCDVNLVILVKTKNKDETEKQGILLGKRSEDVATFPGYWSIVPSGGFELSEKTITPQNRTNQFFTDKIRRNFNVIYALYREYLEEVFNLSDYENLQGNDDINQLENNKSIKKMKGWEPKFVFLGVCFNLIILRQTLSFVLQIEDGDRFLEEAKQHNHENSIIEIMSVEDVKNLIESESPLMVELVGTVDLLKKKGFIS